MKKPAVLLLVLVAIAMVGLACGGGGETKAITPTATATREATTPIATPTEEASNAESGRQLAQAKGCLGCHSTDGSARVGPSWKGLYGHSHALQDGSTVTVDDAYLLESVRSPGAKVAQGFPPNVMPTFTLTDGEIDAIIAYIETLK
ncbi:MAG: coxB [Dehalococcoidia bacterium]|nr:coxB [Dehalococcoidia bacterium]